MGVNKAAMDELLQEINEKKGNKPARKTKYSLRSAAAKELLFKKGKRC